MLKKLLCSIVILLTFPLVAQVKAISVSTEASPVGGKEAVEQVLQTQLTLPKILLTKSFEKEITIYFEVDKDDNAVKVTFNEGLNNVLRNELIRILKFLKFNRMTAVSETPYEYYLTVSLSTEKYNKYVKQRSKQFLKTDKKADSSYVVNSRADKSPEYYKKGDEGLVEFIIGEIQYPTVAKEKSIEGTVVLEFVVETNGFITNIVTKQGVNGGCTEEAIRIMRLTKWQPAILNNKLVRYKMTYPITFSLRNSYKDNSSGQGQY
ncbi:MAG: TonB family protein [Bacteroidetes bacterium]|jgi:protein TonB|nr:TonB family protein [Bacteroidota bacterium]